MVQPKVTIIILLRIGNWPQRLSNIPTSTQLENGNQEPNPTHVFQGPGVNDAWIPGSQRGRLLRGKLILAEAGFKLVLSAQTLGQCCPTELSTGMKCFVSVLSNTGVTNTCGY